MMLELVWLVSFHPLFMPLNSTRKYSKKKRLKSYVLWTNIYHTQWACHEVVKLEERLYFGSKLPII